MIEYKNMIFNINKKTILIIGYPWPYSYGGHRTTKLCRELSGEYNVICLTRPLFRYRDKLNLEPFKIIQTRGLITIYDPLRYILTLISKLKNKNNKNLFIDSGIVNKINKQKNSSNFKKVFVNIVLKIKFFIDNLIAIPDDHWPWIITSYSYTNMIFKKYKPSLIISSFPVSSHLIAARLKKEHPETKWIADFPDLWSQNHFYPYIKLRKNLDKYLESNSLKDCDKIVTCMPGLAKTLKKIHSSRIEFIPHCTDIELHNKKQKQIIKTEDYVIRYLGTLYEQQITYLELFMKSFEKFIDYLEIKNKKTIPVRVEFVGTNSSCLENLIYENKYSSYFKILPKVSYEESLNLMHSAKILFLPLYFENNKLINIFSSKLIEYIGSRNQCLIVGDHCEDFKLVINNYPLINSEAKCLKMLINSFNNCKETKKKLSVGNKIDIEQFSIKKMSFRFINLKEKS